MRPTFHPTYLLAEGRRALRCALRKAGELWFPRRSLWAPGDHPKQELSLTSVLPTRSHLQQFFPEVLLSTTSAADSLGTSRKLRSQALKLAPTARLSPLLSLLSGTCDYPQCSPSAPQVIPITSSGRLPPSVAR